MLSRIILFTQALVGVLEASVPQLSPAVLLDDDVRAICMHISRDGQTLAVAGGSQKGGDWKVFDLGTGKCLLNGLDSNQRCWGAQGVCLSEDNSLLAVGGNYNHLFVIETKTGKLYWDLSAELQIGVVTKVWFTPDRRYLISTGAEMLIRIWDIENKKAHAVFRFTSTNSNFNAWKSKAYVEKAKSIYEIDGKYLQLNHCALAPDGRKIAVAGNLEGKVPILDLHTGQLVKTIQTKHPVVSALEFTRDGKWLIIAGGQHNGTDGTIDVWNVEKDELVKTFGKHEGTVIHLAASLDKKTVVSGGPRDGFRVWDIPSGKQKFSYFTKEDPRMPRVKVYPDGSRNVQKEARSAGVAFLPDGKTFLIAPNWVRTEVYFHDTATGEPVDYRKRVAELPKVKGRP